MTFEPFRPPGYLSHAYVQTILASLKLRALGHNPMTRSERRVILNTRSGTRLLGYYTPGNKDKPRALAILLHGWEGSSHSTYILRCGRYLHQNGCAIFRLNYRDHGASHHLNKGLFYATLLEEVFEGVSLATRYCQGAPAILVGFSLGGNFAIRIAAKHSAGRHRHLSRVVSISPVLDPEKSTARIDANPWILAYFLQKWRKSLLLKQHLFPDTYQFSDILKEKTLRKMTDGLIHRYSDYKSSHEYFRGYAIQAEDANHLTLPLAIIAAADDPIIPVEDFHALKTGGHTDLIIHPHGGHNGFVEGFFRPAWYDRFIAKYLSFT